MKVKVKLNTRNIKVLKEKMQEALVETAKQTKYDLEQSKTMPYDTGALQNRSTFVDDNQKKQGKVSIVSDTPYARYQYFGISRFTGKKLNYRRDKNPYADSFWFDPYINGKKKNFCQNTFKRILRSKNR